MEGELEAAREIAPPQMRLPPPEKLPLGRAYYWEKTHGWQIFLTQPINGRARNWKWREAMNESRRVAAFLKAQGWPAGSHIVILSKNCAWWILSELAIWMSGHVTVPIYTSVTNDAARRLFQHCGPVCCFLGPLDNPELVHEIPEDITVVRFPNATVKQIESRVQTETPAHLTWDRIVAENEPIAGEPARAAEDVATVIYTSGTTGPPKGALHAFRAFPYFAKAVEQVIGNNKHHRVISYLPLAHIAERALTETAGLYMGWRIFFYENTATFLRDLKRARPTLFFSVPRLYAKFQAGVFEKIRARKLENLLHIPLVGFLVRRRILRRLGLNRVRFAASGSAPIAPDLVGWFRELGLPVTEGYGTTESGITHTAPGGRWRPGFVGVSTPGVETRIAGNGEIQVKSPMNMLGYYHDLEATAGVMTADGFIETGDLGEIDSEGWLKIKGRIKEQFKTAKGKYVSPGAIEMMLEVHEAIEMCLVMGSGLAAPIAIAVLTAEARRLSERPESRQLLEHSLTDLVHTVNFQLAPHERLSILVLTQTRWSVENGFITPTLKLRRAELEAHYAKYIRQWIAQEQHLIWHSEE
ncbi:MAG TPA: AMP-binding protein [Bryobacteraceae bacterium]